MRSLFVAVMITLAATSTVLARAHHRAAKATTTTATASATPADAKPQNIQENDRDPADVALDRKIKGICRGC